MRSTRRAPGEKNDGNEVIEDGISTPLDLDPNEIN